AALVATWGPWFTYQERTIFTFYTIVMVPFVVLAITYGLGLVWGRAGQGSWLQTRRVAVGGVVAPAVLAFAFFWPVRPATLRPYQAWQRRMWNPPWIWFRQTQATAPSPDRQGEPAGSACGQFTHWTPRPVIIFIYEHDPSTRRSRHPCPGRLEG